MCENSNIGCGCEMPQKPEKNKPLDKDKVNKIPRKERAMGALMGLFVGDALGTGCRWYYNIDQKIKEYGPWVSDYTTPKPDRWHGNLKAGDISQTGQITILLLESVIANKGYNEEDFTNRLDNMFKDLSGAIDARDYVTERVIRHVIQQRRNGVAWADAGSLAVGADAAIRSIVLSSLYYKNPIQLTKEAFRSIKVTHIDPLIAAQSLAFALTVCGNINGIPMAQMSQALRFWAKNEEGLLPTFTDAFLQPSFCWSASQNPAIKIEPAWHVCQLFGLACQLDFLAPAAYYLVSRFPDEFEIPVLSALNGGGNNMARASMTGAMAGAKVGLKGIPERFIMGLKDHDRILKLVDQVTTLAENDCE